MILIHPIENPIQSAKVDISLLLKPDDEEEENTANANLALPTRESHDLDGGDGMANSEGRDFSDPGRRMGYFTREKDSIPGSQGDDMVNSDRVFSGPESGVGYFTRDTREKDNIAGGKETM